MSFDNRFASIFKSGRRVSRWLLLIFAVVLAIGLTIVLSLNFIRDNQIDVTLDSVVEQDIVAPRSISYESDYLTGLARDQAALGVPDIYSVPERTLAREQVNLANQLFSFIEVVRQDEFADADTKIQYLTSVEGDVAQIDEAVAENLIELPDTLLQEVELRTIQIIDGLMRQEIREADAGFIPSMVRDEIPVSLGARQEEVLQAIVPQLVIPNSFYDENLSEEARETARTNVEPVAYNVVRDEVILREGETVSNLDIELLTELGLLTPEASWWDIGRNAIISTSTALLLFLYLTRYRENTYERRRYIVLLGILLLLFAIAAVFLMSAPNLLAYLFPAAALGLILAVVFDGRFAALNVIVISFLASYLGNTSLELMMYGMFGSLLAIFTLSDTQRINAFFRAGFIAAIGNVIVITLFNLGATVEPVELLQLYGLAIANGLLSASIALASFYVIGSLFGIVTSLQLQDLSRFDQPLLQELLHRAPGTYHHSIMVANLAEQAADRIGGNSLLARVGAFYHDIGKMQNAPYFSENQEGTNPHDSLEPEVSADIIIGHATNGLKLAKRHRLPDQIQEFIVQHHGTQLVKYFYKKACDAAGANADPDADIDIVDEARFRYAGPIPQTRESGIVMMADAVEATSKAVQPNNDAAIEKLVRSITDDLLSANQLDECGLTIGDIRNIRESFVETLKGRYHVRVKYAGNEELVSANTPPIEAEVVSQEGGESPETNELEPARPLAGPSPSAS